MKNLFVERAGQRIQRRMFFKALGVGLSVPLAMRIARTSLAAPSAAKKRFLLFFMPHGIAPEHFRPKYMDSDRTNFALDQTNISILGPLQPYRSYVNVYEGLKYPAASTHEGCVSVLSGEPKIDTTTPRTTLEHAIAKSLNVRPLILGACSHQPFGIDNHGMLFWNGSPVEPEKSPVKAADTLFAGQMPANADAELQQALLALTETEVQSLRGELGSLTSEASKLQRHLEAVTAVKNQAGSGQSTCSTRPTLPTVEMVRTATANLPPLAPGCGCDYFYDEKNFQLLLSAQLELATQALICNAAQVVALMAGYPTAEFDMSFTQPGQPKPNSGWGWHNALSHTMYQGAPGAQWDTPLSVYNLNPDTRASFARTQLWFTNQLVSKVIAPLANANDPSAPGTKVLDNTLIFLLSEVGDGQDHSTGTKILFPQAPAHLPLVTIGKAAGALRTQQVVKFDTDRPAGELYVALARAMGAMNVTFPDATQPIPGVLT
jgi:hypothetical protein